MNTIFEAWHFISTMDLETVNRFLIYWGIFGIVSSLSISALKIMPMSGRADNSILEFLGTVKKRTGWIIMEIPILIVVIGAFMLGDAPFNPSYVIVGFFVVHYINRALIFPYRIKATGKTLPILMIIAPMLFYIINGYLVGYYFGVLVDYPIEWLWNPRFLIGAALFVFGFVVNIQSDNILMNLRGPGETGYKIPKGGFFKYVSCPNYFGECVEWIGFALMSWNLMGAVYATWVVVPLTAQAFEAHRWYKNQFKAEYPANRRAIIPYIL